jgi:hypothetical protein
MLQRESMAAIWSIGVQKLNVSCQYANLAKTEDIWLKSASEKEEAVNGFQ